jgi:hypothetical protein
MDTTELRDGARMELEELGPESANPRERELWNEERRGAVVLLAALADWRAPLLLRVALELGEPTDTAVVRLLLDAAQERGRS